MSELTKNDLDKINDFFKKLKEKNPNVVMVSAVQSTRKTEFWSPSVLKLGDSEFNVVIVDHLNLIK